MSRAKYSPTLPITIKGIPASVHITEYWPGLPSKLSGHPDSWEPAEPAEVSFIICDREGYEASWLARKLNDAEISALHTEVIDLIEQERKAARRYYDD